MEGFDGHGLRGCDTNYVALDVLHSDGDWADDVECVAEAAGKEIFLGGRVGCWVRAREYGELVAGGFEESNLLNKARGAHVNETGDGWACFVESIRETCSLVGIRGVSRGKTVQVGVRSGLEGQVTEGEGLWCGCDVG